MIQTDPLDQFALYAVYAGMKRAVTLAMMSHVACLIVANRPHIGSPNAAIDFISKIKNFARGIDDHVV